jgi:hypothetical protein
MAALAVATAGNPASATIVALAASQTLGSTSICPLCSLRSWSARAFKSAMSAVMVALRVEGMKPGVFVTCLR